MSAPPLASPQPDLPPIPRTPRRGLVAGAGRHFYGLALWKKLLLVLAIALAVAGLAGSVAGSLRAKPPETVQAQVEVEQLTAVGQHSSLTDEQHQQLDQMKARVDSAKHWFYDHTAPQLWRIGVGFFIGFVLGFAARQFVKTMATLAAVVLVGGGVAIYLGYLDAAGVKANLATGTGWLFDRLDPAKDQLLKFAGASLSGTAGFAIGFIRSKRG